MKFMLNGALTIATLDGANVEIAELVGEENIYTFGRSSEDIVYLYDVDGYQPKDYYGKEIVKPLVDFIVSDDMLELGSEENLKRLYEDMINNDYFMTLIDLEEFIAVKEKVYEDYEHNEIWQRKSLINTAKAGYFSVDRTISDYNKEIWHLSE